MAAPLLCRFIGAAFSCCLSVGIAFFDVDVLVAVLQSVPIAGVELAAIEESHIVVSCADGSLSLFSLDSSNFKLVPAGTVQQQGISALSFAHLSDGVSVVTAGTVHGDALVPLVPHKPDYCSFIHFQLSLWCTLLNLLRAATPTFRTNRCSCQRMNSLSPQALMRRPFALFWRVR